MIGEDGFFVVRLAEGPEDLIAAQRLRYQVFVEELGADGPLVDHAHRLERDAFDPLFDHLLLIDTRRDALTQDQVVGVYRLLRSDALPPGSAFYSEGEYDLTPLRRSGRRLMELGRSCIHPDYRGGTGLMHLWNGLADYVLRHGVEVMFGTASFHGTDVEALAPALSLLAQNHLAPQALRVRAKPPHGVAMDRLPEGSYDRRAAMASVPPLIKAYLRLGGFVGEGAWVDHQFNTTDVCLVMDTARMSAKHRAHYLKRQERTE